jgi:hypothetical protein
MPRPWPARWLAWWGRNARQRLRHPPQHFDRVRGSIREAGRFDARNDALFEQAATEFDLIQIREHGFLNWRYVDPRAGRFTIRLAEHGELLLGYAVLRADAQGADLADLLALPGRLDVVNALLRDALAVARRAGAPSMRMWMTRTHPYYPVVQQHGFIRVHNVVVPSFGPASGDPAEIAFLRDPSARVHLALGDSDHV